MKMLCDVFFFYFVRPLYQIGEYCCVLTVFELIHSTENHESDFYRVIHKNLHET